MTGANSLADRGKITPCRSPQPFEVVRIVVFGSECVDRRETRLSCDAVPKVYRKPDVTRPKRIPSAANNYLSAPVLDDRRHSELACAVEPDRVVRAAVELKECVAISARAVAEVRALGEWSGRPGEATRI